MRSGFESDPVSVQIRKESVAAYEEGPEWVADTERLQTALVELTLRLNPTEREARNLIFAAKKLDQATRLHSPPAVLLANELMVRHAQWVLKAEWDQVKWEASGSFRRIGLYWRRRRRRRAYDAFLRKDGSLERLNRIGAGATELELTQLRSGMDL